MKLPLFQSALLSFAALQRRFCIKSLEKAPKLVKLLGCASALMVQVKGGSGIPFNARRAHATGQML
jgi:hypothetical protein